MPKTKANLRREIGLIFDELIDIGVNLHYRKHFEGLILDLFDQTMKRVIGLTEELAYHDPERKEKLDIRNQLRKEIRNKWEKELKGK